MQFFVNSFLYSKESKETLLDLLLAFRARAAASSFCTCSNKAFSKEHLAACTAHVKHYKQAQKT